MKKKLSNVQRYLLVDVYRGRGVRAGRIRANTRESLIRLGLIEREQPTGWRATAKGVEWVRFFALDVLS